MNTTPIKKHRFIQYSSDYLKNGSANNMNVNGSSTPVEYSVTIPQGHIWGLDQLSIAILDSGSSTSAGNFGGLGGLTNGLKIEMRIRGNVFEFANLKNNVDIATTFVGNTVAGGAVGTLDNNIGFMASVDNYLGIVVFRQPIIFSATQGDYIKATVRDNLSGLDLLGIKYLAWREF